MVELSPAPTNIHTAEEPRISIRSDSCPIGSDSDGNRLVVVNLLSPRIPRSAKGTSHGEKTGPGHCSEQQLIAQSPPMINQAREVFCQRRFPASLIYVIYVLIVSPSPSRRLAPGRQVSPVARFSKAS